MNTLGILNQLKQDISWESTFKTMKMVIFNTLLFRLKTFCFVRRKKSSKRLPWVIGGAFVFVILCNLSPRVCLCDVILYRPFQSTPHQERTHILHWDSKTQALFLTHSQHSFDIMILSTFIYFVSFTVSIYCCYYIYLHLFILLPNSWF